VEIDELEVPSSVVYVMLSCSCFYWAFSTKY
jgi:hypothetical protein